MSEVIYLNSLSPASNATAATRGDGLQHVGQGANKTIVSAEAIARAMTTGETTLDHPPVLDMPRIVWIVLRSARRFGRKPSCVPKFVAADLARHCALGDPTAQLMRDWIADDGATLDDVPAPVVAAVDGIGTEEG